MAGPTPWDFAARADALADALDVVLDAIHADPAWLARALERAAEEEEEEFHASGAPWQE